MLRYPRTPIGIYTYEDDLPSVESIAIPSNIATRFARRAWEFAEDLDDLLPGARESWNWAAEKLPFVPEI